MKPLLSDHDGKLISILTPSEQIIIVMYYGLGDRHYTVNEIAQKFDISTQTVSKYRDKALGKLEKYTSR
ncbi:MAG: sigma factor-like helix-turn-helix DNA-binding protein [Patescibacteria group bacterium]